MNRKRNVCHLLLFFYVVVVFFFFEIVWESNEEREGGKEVFLAKGEWRWVVSLGSVDGQTGFRLLCFLFFLSTYRCLHTSFG